MTRRKMNAADLRLGMYVADLDRPWIDGPFLFQGFVISSKDELTKLRDTCRYVYIDDAPDEDPSERTIRLSMNPRPDGNPRQSRSEWQRIPKETN